MEWGRFFRDRFDLFFVTSIFFTLILLWMRTGDADIKTFAITSFGAVLGTINAYVKKGTSTNIQTDSIKAENIETANTQEGDIITTPSAKTTKGN